MKPLLGMLSLAHDHLLRQGFKERTTRPCMPGCMSALKKTLRTPRVDRYYLYTSPSLNMGVPLGVKDRGHVESATRTTPEPLLELKLCHATANGCMFQGLQKWEKKTAVKAKDVEAVVRQEGYIMEGETMNQAGCVDISKRRTQGAYLQMDELVVGEGHLWISLCIEGSKMGTVKRNVANSKLFPILSQLREKVVYGGYPTFVSFYSFPFTDFLIL